MPLKFCILTFGSLGDVLPLAALGGALAARGHEVTLWCGSLHIPMVERLGVRARPLETDALPTMKAQASPVLKAPRMWRRVEQGFRAGYAAVESEVESGASPSRRPIVIASTFALAGRMLQEKLGLKLATVHLSPLCLASFLDMPPIGDLVMPSWMPLGFRPWIGRRIESLICDPVMTPDLNAFRAELGLPPVRRVLSQWMHSPDLVLGFFPPWFAPSQPDWPKATKLLDFPLIDAADPHPLSETDPDLEEFLRSGPPPVIFYPGSARRDATTFFEEVLHNCGQLQQRAILLTRYPEFVAGGAQLPPWAIQRAYVPLSKLLPRSAALVHFGGVGTMAQALAAACPQLLLPYYYDHFDNARHLKRLGLARVHRGSGWQHELSNLLSDGAIRHNCVERSATLPASESVLSAAADAIEYLA